MTFIFYIIVISKDMNFCDLLATCSAYTTVSFSFDKVAQNEKVNSLPK